METREVKGQTNQNAVSYTSTEWKILIKCWYEMCVLKVTLKCYSVNYIRFGRFLYTAVHCLIVDQYGTKLVGVCILKHYCNFNEVCAFVDLHCHD
jgi:hypothetical protein